jgi:hypothetical protein
MEYWCHVCNNETTVTQNMQTGLLICNICQGDFIEQREQRRVIHIDPMNIMLIIQEMLNNGQLNNVLNESLYTEPSKIPTSKDFIDQIKTIILSDSQIKMDCNICYDNFQKELKGYPLPCGHIYHEGCIKEWLKIDHVCPTCRHELPKQEDEGHQSSDDE